MFNADSNEGLTFLTKIRLGLSHLADQKFRYNFQDYIKLVCSCDLEIQTSTHFLIHCSNYYCARQTLFEKVKKVDSSMLKQIEQFIIKFLLFGNEKLKTAPNKSILASTFVFLQATERFKTSSLFNYVSDKIVSLTHYHF